MDRECEFGNAFELCRDISAAGADAGKGSRMDPSKAPRAWRTRESSSGSGSTKATASLHWAEERETRSCI